MTGRLFSKVDSRVMRGNEHKSKNTGKFRLYRKSVSPWQWSSVRASFRESVEFVSLEIVKSQLEGLNVLENIIERLGAITGRKWYLMTIASAWKQSMNKHMDKTIEI